MTKRAGRSVVERSGLAGDPAVERRQHLPRRQVVGLPRARRARHHERGEPRRLADSRCKAVRRDAARGDDRLRALLRRLQGQPRLCACRVAKTAYDAGARWVVLCDTNGGHAAARDRAHRRRGREASCPARNLGIHTHNDTENAVANYARWRCAPAAARSRARSTGSASAAATPT